MRRIPPTIEGVAAQLFVSRIETRRGIALEVIASECFDEAERVMKAINQAKQGTKNDDDDKTN